MLRGLINGHPDCICEFENWKKADSIKANIKYWGERAKKVKENWGCKIPVEQFASYEWKVLDVAALVDYFKIVFILRRYSKYKKKNSLRQYYKAHWQFCQEIYWEARERDPKSVIAVSYEDLLLRPQIELMRICSFLDISYSDKAITSMLQGLVDTGHPKYNYGELKTEKV